MGKQEVMDIRSARNLAQQLRNRHFNGGCLEVSMRALGANCDFEDTLRRRRVISEGDFDTPGYLEKYGLRPVAYALIDEEVTTGEMKQILDSPRSIFPDHAVPAPSGMIKGCMFEFDPPEDGRNGIEIGHALAVLHRDVLPRRYRKDFKQTDAHMGIDLSLKEVVGQVNAESVTKGINDALERGYRPIIFFLAK